MESPGKIELPKAFEHADIDHLVVLIADMLDRLIEHNDKIPLSPEALTRFHSRTPPTISVLDYLRRIVKYANVERTCLLITLHYIDQICARLPHFTLSSLTCHRFIITAVVVASKALCDAFCTNAHYAKVGGIRVGELNVLEKELLNAIDWRLTSTREVLDAYYVNLIRTHSTGAYTLATETTSPALTDVDSDMDDLLSASPSPTFVPATLEDEKPLQPQLQPQTQVILVNGILNASNSIAAGGAANRLSTEPQPVNIEPSTVLIDRATLSPKPSTGPTLEQNMAFEALRQQASSSTSSSSSAQRRMSLSFPNAAAANTDANATGMGSSSFSSLLSSAPSGAVVSEQNGSLTHSHPPTPRAFLVPSGIDFNSQAQSQSHSLTNPTKQSSSSSSPSSNSALSSALLPTSSELLSPPQPPPSTSPVASSSPTQTWTKEMRSPNKRSVEHAYAYDAYAQHAVKAISSKNYNENESAFPKYQTSSVVEAGEGLSSEINNTKSIKKLVENDTYVDIDVDVDIDSVRPRTRMRIDQSR